jgi:peroxiredoxin Q/BCP
MLEVGAPLPQFSLRNHDGRMVTSDDLGGSWTLLYWFPKADTPGCTAQAEGLRDQLDVFDELGCRVIGASFDGVDDLARFRDRYGLGFDLLSDPDHDTGRAFGVAGPDGRAEHPSRTAFLVDPAGTVVRVYEVSDPEFFAESVLDDLESLARGA